MSQPLLPIGINIAKFEEDKATFLASVKDLFAQLNAYDNTKISPVSITGLTELNASVNQTNSSLTGLKTTISEFALAMQVYNKTNSDVAKTQAQISVASSQEAKDLAALKVQLAELNKQNIQQAKDNNQIIQQRLLQDQQRKALADKEKQDLQSIAILRKQNAQAIEKENAEKAIADKAAIKEAKETLLLNDSYKQLILRIKELQSEYARLYASGFGKTPEAKAVLTELGSLNNVSNQIDKNLEKAGSSGATALARGLTGILSQLRLIAYILPGIGLAGIFNLAFQAIDAAAGSLFDFRTEFEKIIQRENDFAQGLSNSNKLLEERTQILKDQQSVFNTEYYKNQLGLSTAAGENPSKQFEATRLANKATKEQADLQVESLDASYSKQADLLTQLQSLNQQKEKIAQGLDKANKDLLDAQNTKIPLYGVVDENLKKAGKISGIKAIQEDFKNQLDALNSQSAAIKDIYDKSQEALINQTNADAAIKEQALKEEKYYYDERRKIILDGVETEVSESKKANDLILSNQLSTQKQREDALKSNLELDKRLAKARLDFTLTDKSLDPNGSERIKAQNDFNRENLNNTKETNRQIENVDKEFYARESQLEIVARENEISINQYYNEQLFKNDEKTYYDRFEALQKYLNDRNAKIDEQYLFDADKAKRETPPDLLEAKLKELQTYRDEQKVQVESNVQQDIYSIIETWYKKRYDLIKSSETKDVQEVTDNETKALTKLNESYGKRIIGYTKFEREKRKIEQQFLVESDKARITEDEKILAGLFSLRNQIKDKLDIAKDKFENAPTEDDAKKAGLEVSGLLKLKKENDAQILDADKAKSKDELQYQIDLNKQKEANQKQFYTNLILLEKSLYDTIKKYVDESYEYRIDRIEEQIKKYDESVEREKDAIDRSTLNQKQKNAYEVQLEAQKTEADEEASRKERKLKHDEAVFNRDIDIAQIITATSLAVVNTLKVGGAFSIPLAFTVGALGAIALAAAVATKIPSYAKGGTHKEDGLALYGEAGFEEVKEPNKKPYVATRPTLGWLSAGTQLRPLYDTPTISEKEYKTDSWDQTVYLANVIKKTSKKTNSTIKANINISFKDIEYKNNIIHG